MKLGTPDGLSPRSRSIFVKRARPAASFTTSTFLTSSFGYLWVRVPSHSSALVQWGQPSRQKYQSTSSSGAWACSIAVGLAAALRGGAATRPAMTMSTATSTPGVQEAVPSDRRGGLGRRLVAMLRGMQTANQPRPRHVKDQHRAARRRVAPAIVGLRIRELPTREPVPHCFSRCEVAAPRRAYRALARLQSSWS